MSPDNEQKKIIAKLKQSNNKINEAKNSQEFCEAFKERCKMGYGFGAIPGSKEILKKIKNTKDKNIQMCIALYYKNDDVTKKLYFQTKDEKIRIACLEKVSFQPLWQCISKGPEKEFHKFLKTSSDKELYAYFTNENFHLSFHIQNILDKKRPYDKISEKSYRNIILILEDNPHTQVDPNDLYEEYVRENTAEGFDGWLQYDDQKTFKAYKKELNLIKKLRNLE